MTTEGEFQSRLDAEPDNHTVRLVFADWLHERDDPRAEGGRALGRLQKFPVKMGDDEPGNPVRWVIGNASRYKGGANKFPCHFPRDWYETVAKPNTNFAQREGRREMEDALALGLATLPPERSAERLAGLTSSPAASPA